MVGGRARPHVGKEGVKGFAPAVANGDAASAVAGVRLVLRVAAARHHTEPDGVKQNSLRVLLTVATDYFCISAGVFSPELPVLLVEANATRPGKELLAPLLDGQEAVEGLLNAALNTRFARLAFSHRRALVHA